MSKPTRAELAGQSLTATETETLILLASGLRHKQIARMRIMSARTICTHAHTIIAKLGVRTSFDAAQYAWRNGVVSVEQAWNTLSAVSE